MQRQSENLENNNNKNDNNLEWVKSLPRDVQVIIFSFLPERKLVSVRRASADFRQFADKVLLLQPDKVLAILSRLMERHQVAAAKFIHEYPNLYSNDQTTAEKIICYALTMTNVNKIDIGQFEKAIEAYGCHSGEKFYHSLKRMRSFLAIHNEKNDQNQLLNYINMLSYSFYNLQNLVLSNAWLGAKSSTVFNQICLSGINARNGNITGVFSEVNFMFADFRDACFMRTNFSGNTNFIGANLTNVIFEDCCFRSIVLDETTILTGVSFFDLQLLKLNSFESKVKALSSQFINIENGHLLIKALAEDVARQIKNFSIQGILEREDALKFLKSAKTIFSEFKQSKINAEVLQILQDYKTEIKQLTNNVSNGFRK